MESNLLYLLRLMENTRGIGKTTSAVDLAKENDATLICFNRSFSSYCKKKYGYDKIISLDQVKNLNIDEKVVLDQDTTTFIIQERLDPNHVGELLIEVIKENLASSLVSPNPSIRLITKGLLEEGSLDNT